MNADVLLAYVPPAVTLLLGVVLLLQARRYTRTIPLIVWLVATLLVVRGAAGFATQAGILPPQLERATMVFSVLVLALLVVFAARLAKAFVTAGDRSSQAASELAALVDSSEDAIYSRAPDGTLCSWNQGAERLFGFNAREAVGKSIELIVPEPRREEERELRRRVLAGESVGHHETERMHKDGSLIDVSVSVSPIRTPSGEVIGVAGIARDVGERRQSELDRQRLLDSLQVSEHRLSRIIETAHEAFVSMDAEGRITGWNGEAEATFGWPRDEAIGRDLAETIIPPAYRSAHREGMKRYLQTGEGPVLGARLELSALHHDGHEFPVEFTITAVETGDQREFHAFLHDISERKEDERRQQESAQQLQRLNQELQRADEMKSQFLSMAAHELRTPLTAVAGFASTMRTMWETLPDDEKLKFLDIIDEQTKRLSRLVDDLLTLSRIEAGIMASGPAHADVAMVIKQTIRELGAESVEVACDDGLEAAMAEDHLKQVLVNYLSNAVKYGDEPIRIEARQADGLVQIRVCDHGPGVPESFVPRLFERFTRADTVVAGQVSGTGLGLSIVKALANAHGGECWYEPNEPTGACFTMRVPIGSGARTAG